MTDLIFKYGDGVLPEKKAGTVYIKKSGNTKADMYVDSPEATSQRLRIGSDVYVGDPKDTEAKDYEVIINPNGEVINNVVTSEEAGGFVIRVVSSSDPDNYKPDGSTSNNMITLVI